MQGVLLQIICHLSGFRVQRFRVGDTTDHLPPATREALKISTTISFGFLIIIIP